MRHQSDSLFPCPNLASEFTGIWMLAKGVTAAYANGPLRRCNLGGGRAWRLCYMSIRDIREKTGLQCHVLVFVWQRCEALRPGVVACVGARLSLYGYSTAPALLLPSSWSISATGDAEKLSAAPATLKYSDIDLAPCYQPIALDNRNRHTTCKTPLKILPPIQNHLGLVAINGLLKSR